MKRPGEGRPSRLPQSPKNMLTVISSDTSKSFTFGRSEHASCYQRQVQCHNVVSPPTWRAAPSFIVFHARIDIHDGTAVLRKHLYILICRAHSHPATAVSYIVSRLKTSVEHFRSFPSHHTLLCRRLRDLGSGQKDGQRRRLERSLMILTPARRLELSF